ncbi:MAG: ABC transporter permease subunit [Rhodospirillales bacterium]
MPVPAAVETSLYERLIPWLERYGRTLVITVAFGWLLLFFLAPFLIVLKISFSEPLLAQPPYAPAFRWVEAMGATVLEIRLNVSNYLMLVEDSLYVRAFANSLVIAAGSTALTMAIGLPMAYAIARAPERWRPLLVVLVILPFWTSFLIRVYAWIGILKPEGLLNALLLAIGVIDTPLAILNTNVAVVIGIVYSYLPFMILPIYASLDRLDVSLGEAAVDLGCRPGKVFWVITVPLARPGIIAGCLLVFIPAVGEFVIPDLLGGSGTLMIGRTLWLEFFNNRDWPLASAVAIVLLVTLVLPIAWFQRSQGRAAGGA